MENQIEKRIELKAPVARVWRALTDYREFGQWFRVALEGPFVVGKVSRGRILHPGYEHIVWEALIEKMEPEQLFAFTWPQSAPSRSAIRSDYSHAPRTLVEFRWKRPQPGRCWWSPIWIRECSRRVARRCHARKRRWLDAADEEHREPCRAAVLNPRVEGRRRRCCLRRWATRHALLLSRGSARGSPGQLRS